MVKGKIENYVLTICFIILLIAPLVTINKQANKVSTVEKRYLANFPIIFDENGKISNGARSEIETWLNDNIGFRDNWVKLSSNFKLKVLGTSPSEKVHIGREGWYFYTNDNNLQIAQGKYPLTEEDLQKTKDLQQFVSDTLKREGKDYLLVLPASKASIYPEYINGGQYAIRRTPSDIVEEYIKSNTDVNVLKLKPSLLEEKEKGTQLYFKTDTHWNEQGAYVAYKTIINTLNELGIVNSTPVDVEWKEDEYKGEFSAMMGDGDILPSEPTKVSEIISSKAQKLDETDEKFYAINQAKQKYNSEFETYIYRNNSNLNGKKVLIFGDSLFAYWNMTELLAENFYELTYMWTNQVRKEYIDAVNPDLVIFEIGERYLSVLDDVINKNNLLGSIETPKASISSIEAPNVYERNNKYKINVTVKNEGTECWSEDRYVRLGVFLNGLDEANYSYRAIIPEGVTVQPGEEFTFTIDGVQITNDEVNFFEVQMLQEGVLYFGQREKVNIIIK